MNLSGKTALVTGGASGLGRAVVEAMLDAGTNVVVCDLPHRAEEVADLGKNVVFAGTDVSDAEQVQNAITQGVEAFGGLQVAVNCAGIAWAQRTVDKNGPHPLEVFQKVVEVNLVGTFNVIRLAAAQMAKQEPDGEERGVIVNTASIAAFDGQIGQVAYAASKGGVVSMTLPIARDLSRQQIRVNTIAPGTMNTPMLALLSEDQRKQLAAGIPHPARLGEPSEFAAMVRHICENAYINGETIRLDGSLRMPPK
jgi:NAD(P)-dependent dehydrogenase (short-subunit alcohol dehydrogenase family)